MDIRRSEPVVRQCRVCGRRYRLDGKRQFCKCGGYIYTVSQIYQPRMKHK